MNTSFYKIILVVLMAIPFKMQSQFPQFLFGNNDKSKEMEKACNVFTD